MKLQLNPAAKSVTKVAVRQGRGHGKFSDVQIDTDLKLKIKVLKHLMCFSRSDVQMTVHQAKCRSISFYDYSSEARYRISLN